MHNIICRHQSTSLWAQKNLHSAHCKVHSVQTREFWTIWPALHCCVWYRLAGSSLSSFFWGLTQETKKVPKFPSFYNKGSGGGEGVVGGQTEGSERSESESSLHRTAGCYPRRWRFLFFRIPLFCPNGRQSLKTLQLFSAVRTVFLSLKVQSHDFFLLSQ